MAAAREILETTTLVGMDRGGVERHLGPPTRIERGRLFYMRHNGEIGTLFALRVENDAS